MRDDQQDSNSLIRVRRVKGVVKLEPSLWYFAKQHLLLNYSAIVKRILSAFLMRSLISVRNSDFLQGSIGNEFYSYWAVQWNISRNVVRFLRSSSLFHQGQHTMEENITDHALFNVFYLFQTSFWGSYIVLRHLVSFFLDENFSLPLSLMLVISELITIFRQTDSISLKLDHKKILRTNRWSMIGLVLQVLLNKLAITYLHGWDLTLTFTGISLLTELITWWFGYLNLSGKLNFNYAYKKTQRLFLTSSKFRTTLRLWLKESVNLLIVSLIGTFIINSKKGFFKNVRATQELIISNFFFFINLTDSIYDIEHYNLETLVRNMRNMSDVGRSIVVQSKRLWASQLTFFVMQLILLWRPKYLFLPTLLNDRLNEYFLGKTLNLSNITGNQFSNVYIRHLFLEMLLWCLSLPVEELVSVLNDFYFYNEGIVVFVIDDLLPFIVPELLFNKLSFFKSILIQDLLVAFLNLILLPKTLLKVKENERKRFMVKMVTPYLLMLMIKLTFNYWFKDLSF